MDRIIAPNSVNLAGADGPPAAGVPQYATDGNPALAIPATRWPAYQYNAMQEELIGVIAASGLAPSKADNTQLLQALRLLTTSRLLNATSFYVRSDGNDANDGSANDPAHAWLTPQHGVDVIQAKINLGGNNCTLKLGAGNFSGPAVVGPFVGAKGTRQPGAFIIDGAGPTTILTGTVPLNIGDGAGVTVTNVQLTGTDRNTQVYRGGILAFSNVVFGGTPATFHIEALLGGQARAIGPFTIASSAQAWMSVGASAAVVTEGVTATFTGTPSWSNAGVFTQGGFAEINGMTVAGAATGARYSSTYNGLIWLGGTVLPGNASGITLNGGQVIP